MQNFMKTIINAVQKWTGNEIKENIKNSTADWNENDSSADSYVKNRTHWEETKTIIFADGQELTFTPNDNEVCWTETPFTTTLVEGQSYTVIWDDVEYILEAYEADEGYTILGNYDIWWNSAYSEENANPPFAIESNAIGIYNPSAEETHTVSISTTETIVHTLDSKYLDIPENLATTNDVQGVLDVANAAQSTADIKMDAANPVGTGSFSMNRKSDTTIGDYSHAEGYYTTASGDYSHAEGYYTTASGDRSHAEGGNTTASGHYSHAEGLNLTASGYSSHAEGVHVKASGSYSHAEGYYTTASGEASHAEGSNTTASGKHSHVQGKYNVVDSDADGNALNTYAHIVGNGELDARSNAYTLDWEGNSWYAGDVYVGSTSGTNRDEGSKKLATEEYVNTTSIPTPTTATVGQTIIVKTVDENGKPTAWEAVDPWVMTSSTEGSTKQFKLTVDDSGTLTVTEIVSES